MTKIDYSNRFHIIPRTLLQDHLQFGALPYAPEGSLDLSANSPVSFSQSPESSEHGVSWRQDFSAVVDDRRAVGFSGVRAYIAFAMTDGTLRLIGSAQEAPLITVTPHAGGQRVSASFLSPEPVIF